MKLSLAIRRLLIVMTAVAASASSSAFAVTVSSANSPLFVGPDEAYLNANMETYERSGNRNRYTYTGKWDGDSVTHSDDMSITLNNDAIVYLASNPMNNDTGLTTTTQVSIMVGNGSTATNPVTIASGNGGWVYTQRNGRFTTYAPTTETIKIEGTVTGNGYLRLQGNGTTSTTFTFTSDTTTNWFTGVVSMSNVRGTRTYLSLADDDERWQGAVIDFGQYAATGLVPSGGSYSSWSGFSFDYPEGEASAVGLTLTGNAAVAALSGGAEAGVINGDGHELSLKATDGQTYTYDGSFSSSLSLKMAGDYTQVVTGEKDLGDISVSSGQLNFTGNVLDEDHNSAISITGGLLLVGALQEDGTINPASKAKLYGTNISISGNGGLGVSAGLTASEALTVSGGVLHSVEGAINAKELVLSGGRIYAGVNTEGESTNVGISSGINITGNATVTGGALYTDEQTTIGGRLSVSGGTLQLHNLSAGSLTQTGGSLTVAGNAVINTATIDGSTTSIVTGALTGESLILTNGSQISTGAGTNITNISMGSGSLWNTTGTTTFDTLTFTQIGATDKVAEIHTTDGSHWSAPTHVSLEYATGSSASYAFIMSSESDTMTALDVKNVLTVTGASVTEIMDGNATSYSTITLARLDNMYLPDDVTPTNGVTLVYVLANGKVYEGELFTQEVNGESLLQVGINNVANNSIVVGSGSKLRITHNESGKYDIHREANFSNGSWSGGLLMLNQPILPSRIYLEDGAAFYLNDEYNLQSNVGGAGNVIEILPGTSEIHTENNVPVWNMGGILTGVGHVNLVAHTGAEDGGVTVYRYTNSATDSQDAWFSGTLGLANAHGGAVQLDIGNTENKTRWQNTLFDLGPHAEECIMHSGTTNTASDTVLLLEGDSTIKGLTNCNPDGADSTRVVTNITSGDDTYTLTIGTDRSSTPYVFRGKVGEGTFFSTKYGESTPTEQTSQIGSLNIRKVGSNTQVFVSDATLNEITIDNGTLAFGSMLNASQITVNQGGTLVTTHVGDVPRVNIQGGSSWYIRDDMMSSATSIVFSGSGSVYMGTYDGNTDAVFYLPIKLNMKDSTGIGYSPDQALFTKKYGDTMTVNTDNALNFTYSDTKTGDVIYVTNNVMNSREQSLLQDVEGRFVDVILDDAGNPVDSVRYYAEMNFDSATGQLTATRTDTVVYTWMGEASGTSPDDSLGCINPDADLVYGHVWTTETDSSGHTVNTGWHEQDMGAGQGVFVNGAYVDFLHAGIHGESVAWVDVDIRGEVSPGHIYVNTENSYRGDAEEGTPISYGFAFSSTDESGVISDFGDTPTRLVKEGKGMLIIDVDNHTTGGISLRHGSIYAAVPNALGLGDVHMHDGTTVYVNYLHSNDPVDDHRHPVIGNNFTLTSGADVTIGYAPFVYEYKDQTADGVQSVTRHWRYLLLDGTFKGDKDSTLRLKAYNSCWIDKAGNRDPYLELYTSGFILKNSDQALGGHFHGTVKLENEVNTSQLTNSYISGDQLYDRWTGEVRLQLSDDYLRNAHLDASRQGVWTTPLYENSDGSFSSLTPEFRQTSRQLILLEGDTTLRGLSATLLGSTPESFLYDNVDTYYSGNRGTNLINYIRNSGHEHLLTYDVADEVDLVHVSTSGDFVLNLNNDGQEYWYSGKMGYATQYVGTEQEGKTYYDPLDDTTGETLGKTLSLVMDSTNGSTGAQYIHSAQLVNLTLRQGTLGFNQLDVSGDVFMNTDTTLKLSVQTETSSDLLGKTVDTSWKTVDEDGLVIRSGKALTVNILAQNDTPAVIDGNVTLSANSSLHFIGNNIDADNGGVEFVFLDVNGTLTINNNESLNLTLQGVNFPFVGFTPDGDGSLRQTWYIAEADEIIMTGEPLTFTERIIQLESGYVGLIGVKDEYLHTDGSTNDYITVTVLGEPRRTWTGNTGNQTIDNILDENDVAAPNAGNSNEFEIAGTNNGYQWVSGSFGEDGELVKISNKWKEELTFFNGCLTLFGNLYNSQSAKDTTVVDTNTALQPGWITGDTAPEHSVDDEAVAYQYVEIVDDVAPMMVTVNGDYYDSTGKLNLLVDATNYVFAGDGYIRDVTQDELGDFYGYNNLENLKLIDWHTSLSKEGRGVLVITNANTYSGGTLLQGGRIVMQNASALGTGTVTISGASVLQADFADADNARTSTVTNVVRAFNRDASGVGFGTTYGGDSYVAALVNDSDKRMIIKTLTGQSDAALLLNAQATTEAQREKYGYKAADTYATGSLGTLTGDKYTIGVYEIQDAAGYLGTIRMQGMNLSAGEASQEMEETSTGTGVQLNVNDGTDWSHLGIDLSLNNSASTALCLANGSITLPVLSGSADGGSGVSHVVTTIGGTNNLTISATRTAAYFGNLGFGFYQEEDGTLEYNTGVVNLTKTGAGNQTVGNAELGSLHLEAGKFYVTNVLQADSISNEDATSKIRVGSVDGTLDAAPHTIVVDEGGILALGSGNLTTDVLSGVSTGAAAEDGKQVHVMLGDGATLAAHDDWTTAKNIDIHQNPSDAGGTSVTINTHHFEVDPWDYNQLGTEAASEGAHIIRLNRGNLTGDNATVNVTNDALTPDGAAAEVASSQQGYVQVKDLNQLTNSVWQVRDMATLQLTNGTSSAGAGTNEVDIRGHEATLQLVTGKTTTAAEIRLGYDPDGYDSSALNGGQVYIGGSAVMDNSGHTASDTSGMTVRLRAYTQEGEMADGVLQNVAMTSNSARLATMTATNGAAQASMKNSMAAIQDSTTLALKDVLVKSDSILHGGDAPAISPAIVPSAAAQAQAISAAQNPNSIDIDPADSLAMVTTTKATGTSAGTTVEITTSGDTLYTLGSGSVYHALVDQFNNVDVSGNGVTLVLMDSLLRDAVAAGANVIALQISGGAGRFFYEQEGVLDSVTVLTASGTTATLIDSGTVEQVLGVNSVSVYNLYLTMVPEPTTATLSLMALAALAARRRRK